MAVYALPAPTIAEALDPAFRARQRLELIRLSPRERQVAEMLAAGRTIDEIGESLGIGRRWVGRITRNLCGRTGAANRTHLIAELIRAGKIR